MIATVRKIILATMALGILALVAYVARQWHTVSPLVHPTRLRIDPQKRAEAQRLLPGLVDVDLRARDAVRLSGWYTPGTNGAAILFAHGVWSNRTAFLPEAARLAERGYGVLLYDSRAHGESDGDTCTWGDRERADVAAAVDFLASRPEVQRLGAVGLSIGSYAVALAAERDARLRAIVLEGATPSFREGEAWDESAFKANVDFALYHAYGLRIDDINVVASLHKMAPRPVLVVVGSADPYIPPWMSDEVLAAAPEPKALYVVRGAGHGGYVAAAGNSYLDRLLAFFDDSLR
jgi:uncharacterized protein